MTSAKKENIYNGTGKSDAYFKEFQKMARSTNVGDYVRLEESSDMHSVVSKQYLYMGEEEGFWCTLYTVRAARVN